MPTLLHPPSRALSVLGALAVLAGLALAGHSAAAQSETGTVTGRVLWSACIRGIPLPMTPDGQAQPGAGAAPDAPNSPGLRPVPGGANGLPAGAVLVAVQNTAISARTDEAGRFTLSGVPAGQYLTVAAGPVADSVSAIAARPNVFVSGGQSVDLGTLSLGGNGGSPFSIACRLPAASDNVVPGASGTTDPGNAPNP